MARKAKRGARRPAAKRRSTGTTAKRRRGSVRRKTSTRGASAMKRRRRKSSVARAGTTTRRRRRGVAVVRRRSVRRRRGGSLRGVVPMLIEGGKDAVIGVGAKAAVRIIRSKAGFESAGAIGVGVELAAAAAVGLLAGKFLGANAARAAVQGALMAPVEAFIKGANVPLVSAALGDVGDYADSLPGVGGYPGLRMSDSVSGYPGAADAVGGYDGSDGSSY